MHEATGQPETEIKREPREPVELPKIGDTIYIGIWESGRLKGVVESDPKQAGKYIEVEVKSIKEGKIVLE